MSNHTAATTDPTGNKLASYRAALQNLPPVTPGEYTERSVRTNWIGGIYINDRHDPNTTVELSRWAIPAEEDTQADIEYEVRLTNSGIPICLTVEAAQLLGACLLQAAATATWDLVDNVDYLTGENAADTETTLG